MRGHPLEEVSLRRSGPGDRGLRVALDSLQGALVRGRISGCPGDHDGGGGQGREEVNRWRWGAGPQAGSPGGASTLGPGVGGATIFQEPGLAPYSNAASPGAPAPQRAGAAPGTRWAARPPRPPRPAERRPRHPRRLRPSGPRRPPPRPPPRSSRSPGPPYSSVGGTRSGGSESDRGRKRGGVSGACRGRAGGRARGRARGWRLRPPRPEEAHPQEDS